MQSAAECHAFIVYCEAGEIAEELGMRFLRAGSLNDHPTFVSMIAEVIEACS